MLEEITNVGGAVSVTRVYTYGHRLISQDQLLVNGNGGLVWVASFYGYDGHGNTRHLTTTSTTMSDAYDYDAFGGLIARIGTTPNIYLYSSQQFDIGLSLYYNRDRYLNVNYGRFWTMDSLEGDQRLPVSMHRFLYVNADPVNLWDPSGKETLASQQAGVTIDEINGKSVILYLTRAGRKVAKVIACGTGVVVFRQAVLEEVDRFGLEAHHGKPRVFGGTLDPTLLLDATLHRTFHKAINAFLQAGGLLPENAGSETWKKLLTVSGTKKAVFEANMRAAALIDRACKLKGPLSLVRYTREAWQQEGGIP